MHGNEKEKRKKKVLIKQFCIRFIAYLNGVLFNAVANFY